MSALIVYILVFFSGAFSGGWVTGKALNLEIAEIKSEQARKDLVAADTLAERNKLIGLTYVRNAQLNSEMEVSHEQNLATINALHGKLTQLARMPKPTTKIVYRGVPQTSSPRSCKPSEETRNTELSDSFREILIEQATSGDKVSLYAQECYQFVNTQNCGVEK